MSTKVLMIRFLLSIFGLVVVISGCQTNETKNQYVKADNDRPLVDEKYSLQSDREAVEQLRQDIPAAIRNENDQKALMLNLFGDSKKPPAKVREEFDQIVRKKRELFDRDLQKEREKFNQQERKNRDVFLKQMAQTRGQFMQTKSSKDARDDFFKEQEDKRKEYFANERERRQDFESDVRERRKNFEDYMREKQNEFHQELKAFTKKRDEFEKEAKKQSSPVPMPSKVSNESKALQQELESAKALPRTNLESGE